MFNPYSLLVLASCVCALPAGFIKTPILKRNAALDAALSAQGATTYLVCQLSYQTTAAGFALGIGSAPVACISSPVITVNVAPVVVTPIVISIPSAVNKPVAISLTPTSSAATSTNTPCSQTGPSSCLIQQQALKGHNDARANHHAKDLVWDDTLANSALKWANNCDWKHSDQTLYPYAYGENLFASTMNYPDRTMNDAMYAFNSEEVFYDYSNPGFTENSGHFTQVVWKDSTHVGCAAINCPLAYFAHASKTSSFFVCHYLSAGNYQGQFADNVQAP